MYIDSYSYTNRGKHSINEDSILNEEHVFAVADGLGGCESGETASARAISYIAGSYQGRADIDIEQLLRGANSAVCALNNGARTTVAAAFAADDQFRYTNVGDSRVYYFRNGKLLARTKDHSVCQASVDSGTLSEDEIRGNEDRSKLLKVLGNEPELKLGKPYPPINACNGDAFIVCSDGFWEYVYEAEMELDLLKADSARRWGEYMLRRHLRRSHCECDNFSLVCGIIYSEVSAPAPTAIKPAPIPRTAEVKKGKKAGSSKTGVIVAAAAAIAVAAAAVLGILLSGVMTADPVKGEKGENILSDIVSVETSAPEKEPVVTEDNNSGTMSDTDGDKTDDAEENAGENSDDKEDGITLEEAKDSIVLVESSTGAGAGFAVGKKGQVVTYIVTNYHIVGNDDSVKVYFDAAEGKMGEAVVFQVNSLHDIAVLKLNEPTNERKPLAIESYDDLSKGEAVYTLGFPRNAIEEGSEGYMSLGAKDIIAVPGVIAQLTSAETGVDVVTTDASIDSGNSGGPLINDKGAVVGIITYKQNSDGSGVSYAVSTNYLTTILSNLKIPFDYFPPSVFVDTAS